MRIRTFVTAISALAVSLPAAAQYREDERNWDARFRGLDRNGDGVVSRSEWGGNRRSFRQHDWNNDGVLSGRELTGRSQTDANQAGSADRMAKFERLDRDSDWRVESQEWPYNRQVFNRLDANGDGYLTTDEFNALRSVTLSQLDVNGNGKLERSEWPFDFATFRHLDQDGNGRISSEEYFSRGSEYDQAQRFHLWDKNNNGFIESTEWKSNARLFHLMDRDFDSRLSLSEFRDESRDTLLKDMDRNNDGMISRNEWKGSSNFDELDVNNDGVLDSEEFFYRGDTYGRQQRFSRIDRNNNGVIEANEWRGSRDLFHDLDTNGNSVMEYEEFSAANRDTGFRESDRPSYFDFGRER